MSDGVPVTENDREIARFAEHIALETFIDGIKESPTSTEECIDELGLRSYVENCIEVNAAHIAYTRFLVNSLHGKI